MTLGIVCRLFVSHSVCVRARVSAHVQNERKAKTTGPFQCADNHGSLIKCATFELMRLCGSFDFASYCSIQIACWMWPWPLIIPTIGQLFTIFAIGMTWTISLLLCASWLPKRFVANFFFCVFRRVLIVPKHTMRKSHLLVFSIFVKREDFLYLFLSLSGSRFTAGFDHKFCDCFEFLSILSWKVTWKTVKISFTTNQEIVSRTHFGHKLSPQTQTNNPQRQKQ